MDYCWYCTANSCIAISKIVYYGKWGRRIRVEIVVRVIRKHKKSIASHCSFDKVKFWASLVNRSFS